MEDMVRNRIYSMDNPKAVKARNFGWLNAIHYMAPSTLAEVGNLCPRASKACEALCLGWFSGQAGMARDGQLNSVRASRIAKARRFMRERDAYLVDLVKATELAEAQAARLGLSLCVRPNGSTDIAWERIKVWRAGTLYPNIMSAFPAVQFTDYTKIASRFGKPLPSNYSLTYSRAEGRDEEAHTLLDAGHNVAIVFAGERPRQWCGVATIDGDEHDLRHLDPRGVVVALSPKGHRAKRDRSGFVWRPLRELVSLP
jgi:hypothetical protein